MVCPIIFYRATHDAHTAIAFHSKLITALYSRNSNFVESDTVFGVKKSLIVDYRWCEDLQLAKQHNLTVVTKSIDGRESTGFWLLELDFMLVKKSPPPSRKVQNE